VHFLGFAAVFVFDWSVARLKNVSVESLENPAIPTLTSSHLELLVLVGHPVSLLAVTG